MRDRLSLLHEGQSFKLTIGEKAVLISCRTLFVALSKSDSLSDGFLTSAVFELQSL